MLEKLHLTLQVFSLPSKAEQRAPHVSFKLLDEKLKLCIYCIFA